MPNWVSNRLVFEGIETEDEADDVLSIMSLDGKFSFESLIPSPNWVYKADFSDQDSGDFTTWYEWNTKNWGTKWDAKEAHVQYDGELTIDFETAWGPHLPFIVAIANVILEPMALRLVHEYIDESRDFHSVQVWEGNRRTTISSTSEELDRLRVELLLDYDDVGIFEEHDK